MDLSVVIPTCNRPRELALCLKALTKQTIAQKFFEVIVIDDGSYKERAKETPRGWPNGLPRGEGIGEQTLKYYRQSHKGPGAARNLGIKKAREQILLFLGDDIIASQNLLAFHLKAHQKNPQENIAILGLTLWHPQLKLTPFMEWLYQSGMQADYQNLKEGSKVSFKHFYTTNVSLKRNFLLENGLFDEDFQYPIFEDTELGYRLSQKGLKIIFQPQALAYHFHQINLNSFLKKMALRGKVGRLLYQKHPELKDIIFPTKLPFKEILRLKFWQILYPLASKNTSEVAECLPASASGRRPWQAGTPRRWRKKVKPPCPKRAGLPLFGFLCLAFIHRLKPVTFCQARVTNFINRVKKAILFQNYQRLTNEALMRGYNSYYG